MTQTEGKTPKLSKAQKEVIQKMRDGKEVYRTTGLFPVFGIYGGKKIGYKTFFALKERALIVERELVSNTSYYKLTDLGKSLPL